MLELFHQDTAALSQWISELVFFFFLIWSNLPFNLERARSRSMFVAEWESLLGCV